MGRWGDREMREKVILLSPHLPIPLSPHPLPHAQCPIYCSHSADREMREKVILLSPHLPIPLSPHPLPHAQCPIYCSHSA
ncbi:hypothetical protein, partial [Nostoc linckia]|uniref:hypothetical protein n=1 Tax=Nostoc linckia TaxID=92942 RepID=UPI001C558FAF